MNRSLYIKNFDKIQNYKKPKMIMTTRSKRSTISEEKNSNNLDLNSN